MSIMLIMGLLCGHFYGEVHLFLYPVGLEFLSWMDTEFWLKLVMYPLRYKCKNSQQKYDQIQQQI